MNTRCLPIVLIAADDLSDRSILQEAFDATRFQLDLRFVSNGEEFLSYLHQQPPWSTLDIPDLILLDLNMPRLDGRQALQQIKVDAELKHIPIVILTASRAEQDISESYLRGANTYIPKPSSREEMTRAIIILCEFWFRVCALPGSPERASDTIEARELRGALPLC